MKHISPEFNRASFHCPHCGVLAEQTWSSTIQCHYKGMLPSGGHGNALFQLSNTGIAKCTHCKEISIWIREKMAYPITGNVETVNVDLPEEIKKDYNEAKDIVNISPRGAAALLRLAIQKLCIHLGEEGKNINKDIASLVKKGLPETMQQALDSVRVVGNNAVHPGVIDFEDSSDTAFALFGFVNIIADVLITQPKKVKEYYEKHVPEGLRQKIAERDKK
jgi:hypothetical protein